MANVKISELTAATSVAATDELEINAGGTSKKATAQKLLDLAAGTANTFTIAQTFQAANAIRSEAASTQDAVVVAGRAGGTASYAVTITPTALSANRTLTLPDATGTVLTTAAAVTVGQGGTGATTLTGILKGNGTSAFTAVTAPSGAIVGTTDTQTLTNKTLTAPTMTKAVLNDGFTEEVFAISDGASVNLDPNNGSIQTWTLGANRTPDQANWAAGQSITLLVDDGSARTLTWTTLAVTWKTNAGTAPTLNTSGYTIIVLWKVGSTIYGARVGDA